jgi:SAM-dependent methyltransferase
LSGARSQPPLRDYYNSYWSEEGFRPTGRLTQPIHELLELHVTSSSDCLDVGCGDGRTSGLWLREHAGSYVGVDVSATAVQQAAALGLDARLIDDAADLPFGDASFDVVLCLEVLEHLFAPHDAAREMLRVLRPGGALLATVPNAAYWRRRLDLFFLGRVNPLGDALSVREPWRDPHIRFFNRSTFRRMLVQAGFAEVHVGGHGGTLTGDLPFIRRLFRPSGWAHPTWRSRPVYRQFERLLPSLLGYRLHAVARKRA